MSKYTPLIDNLKSKPNNTIQVKLRFEEIENMLAMKLPLSAKTQRYWWANTSHRTHSYEWLTAGWKVKTVNFKEKQVVFVRSKDYSSVLNKPKGYYINITRFFENLPSKQIQIALNFKELGEILGRSLPKTAYIDRPWWANTHKNIQGASWLTAGWKLDKVYLKAEIAVFKRKVDNPVRFIPQYVKQLLESTDSIIPPQSRKIKPWIQLCQKLEWYFEGTVLYERSGIVTQNLDEQEILEIEESYAICKRELLRYKNLK